MPHALALSPHLDDAVFSCGGTLARLVQAGWSVTLCTIFTRSVPAPTGFALACQTDKGLPPDADYMALRRAEDAEACTVLGVEPLWLDWPEAPHRGYHDAAALFGPPHAADPAHGLAATLPDLRADLVLAPQAIGGHVDHVLLAAALIQQRRIALWWADFPYAARTTGRQPFAAAMADLPEWRLHGDAGVRLAACAAYRTQLGYQFGGQPGLKAALNAAGPVECFRGDAGLPIPRELVA
ncbi:MAG: PIG-L family deacetylase [Pseudomonadota bacterium]